jgi:prolyl-tRNA editing enzyme YbaK/EbsC (Cys-tRNA(Pro) deacylase)
VTAHPDVLAHLDRLGLEYEVMDCDPDLADTAQFCEAYGVPLEESANAILVASKKPEGHHAVCVALAHTRLDVNGAVRRKLGVRKLSFAPAELTRELTGQEIGGVTIFGLPSTCAGLARLPGARLRPHRRRRWFTVGEDPARSRPARRARRLRVRRRPGHRGGH